MTEEETFRELGRRMAEISNELSGAVQPVCPSEDMSAYVVIAFFFAAALAVVGSLWAANRPQRR